MCLKAVQAVLEAEVEGVETVSAKSGRFRLVLGDESCYVLLSA